MIVRLLLSFIFLLLVTATASAVVWDGLSQARAGDLAARVVVFAGAVIAGFGGLLLARIVIKAQTMASRKEE